MYKVQRSTRQDLYLSIWERSYQGSPNLEMLLLRVSSITNIMVICIMISILIIVQAYKQIYSYRMLSKNKKSECYLCFQTFFEKINPKKLKEFSLAFYPRKKYNHCSDSAFFTFLIKKCLHSISLSIF